MSNKLIQMNMKKKNQKSEINQNGAMSGGFCEIIFIIIAAGTFCRGCRSFHIFFLRARFSHWLLVATFQSKNIHNLNLSEGKTVGIFLLLSLFLSLFLVKYSNVNTKWNLQLQKKKWEKKRSRGILSIQKVMLFVRNNNKKFRIKYVISITY